MSVRFASWLSSLPLGPVVCFGPRVAPPCVLGWARGVGAAVASSGRSVFSGGAAGCDSAFVAGASSVGGPSRVFLPSPLLPVPARFFVRSAAALVAGCGAFVFVPWPGPAGRGGSRWSARRAASLGLPLFLVAFRPCGSFAVLDPQEKSDFIGEIS